MDRSSSVRLTKTIAEKAEVRDTRYDIWDLELTGFGLRVEKSGTKTFIIRYRIDGGGRSAPRRFLTVGRFGTLTVEQARKKAKTLLGAAASGEDPAGDVQDKRREKTVRELLDFYEEHGCFIQRGIHKGKPMKPLTKQYTMARLRNHFEVLLGHRRASEINSGDIETMVADIAAGKTAKGEKVAPRKRIIVRGGEGAARANKAARFASAERCPPKVEATRSNRVGSPTSQTRRRTAVFFRQIAPGELTAATWTQRFAGPAMAGGPRSGHARSGLGAACRNGPEEQRDFSRKLCNHRSWKRAGRAAGRGMFTYNPPAGVNDFSGPHASSQGAFAREDRFGQFGTKPLPVDTGLDVEAIKAAAYQAYAEPGVERTWTSRDGLRGGRVLAARLTDACTNIDVEVRVRGSVETTGPTHACISGGAWMRPNQR
jgi:hypothetical protein